MDFHHLLVTLESIIAVHGSSHQMMYSLQIPWCRSAMQDYIQKVLRQIDELTEQQISAVALFLAVAGSSGGEGRQLLESSFSCLPVLSCAMCLGSSMFCMLYLQVLVSFSSSLFTLLQVNKAHVPISMPIQYPNGRKE